MWRGAVRALYVLPFLAGLALALAMATASAQQLALQRYGKAEGLDNLNINCLLQARDGYLWACTENGFYRYDGERFRRFGENDGLENTLVYAATQDRDGRLWVATSSDLYVGEGGHFEAVRPAGRALGTAPDTALAALPAGGVAVLVRQQVVVVSRAGGGDWRVAPLFDAAQAAATPDVERATGLHVARDGQAWFGCGPAICEFANGRLRRHADADGVPADHWQGFLLDAHGDVWARGSRFVLRLKKGSDRFAKESLPGGALHESKDLAPLVGAADGSVVVRVEKGLARWSGGRWSLWTAANGLPAADVTALMFDDEGSLWIGLVGKGAGRWVGYGRFDSWTHEQGLDSDAVWTLWRPSPERLLAATSGGCSLLEPGAARPRPCRLDGIPPGKIAAMAQEADGALWIGFSSGDLWSLKAGSRARHVTKLPHFTAMLVDSRHRLWIPTRAGVFLKLPDEAQPRRLGDEHEYLDAAEDARGGVWIAGSDGLQRFADGAWTPAPIADRRATPGFASVAIGPDGVLWAASRSRGVVRAVLDGARLRDTRWIDDPLVANASPMFVRIDAARRVWVGTDYGVVVQEPGAADAAGVQPPWRRLTESDGLVWNDVNQASFQADADGSVWIGTSGGLTHIVDPTRAIARRPLQLELTHPRFADRPVTLAKGQQWPWSRSAAFDLELVCLNFSRSMDSVFRYRIVGVDVDWFETSNPKVHYPALEPGSYRFEAVIVDPDRRQSSPIVSYEFEVLPPWWRTLWFRASCALLAGLAMLAAWRWQIGRITARHAMEQQLAKERNLLLERASRDALTGLWNRASILDLLAQALQGRRPGEPVAVAIIDVDHFKRVNDEHGHAVGDKVLRDLGHRLSTKLRQCDLLGRYGGEELLLVMPGLPCEAPANAVERLREGVCDQPFEIPGGPLPVTVSIGVAWLGVPGAGEAADLEDTAQALFERADAALYDAKRNGRNRVSYGVQATGGAVDHEMHAPGH